MHIERVNVFPEILFLKEIVDIAKGAVVVNISSEDKAYFGSPAILDNTLKQTNGD